MRVYHPVVNIWSSPKAQVIGTIGIPVGQECQHVKCVDARGKIPGANEINPMPTNHLILFVLN